MIASSRILIKISSEIVFLSFDDCRRCKMYIYAADYSVDQKEIITELEKNGSFLETKTRLLVLMSTNNYRRTVSDLAGILCEYPGMPDQKELVTCINNCISEGFLKLSNNYGINFCCQDQECLEKFLNSLPEEIQKKIVDSRISYLGSECVTVLGLLSGGSSDGYINASFLQRMKEARKEILLPMLNTSPNENVINILKDQAKNGVKVRILLPDYKKVVSVIRGGKEDMTKEWVDKLRDIPNIDIRIYSTIKDAEIYSSLVIDKTLCRICVFDHIRQKSSNGTLIEINRNGYDLNLMDIFLDKFEDIWLRSRPVSESKIIHFLKDIRTWGFVGMLVSLIVFFRTTPPVNEIALNVFMVLGGSFVTTTYHSGIRLWKNFQKRINKEPHV